MKKYIIATITLILLSSACSSQPDHQSQPNPGPSPAPSGPMMLKGTVSMIINFLAPSAYAMAPAHYGSVGSTVSLPYNTAEIGCQAARCAFLVDTGARDSTSVEGQQPVQASAPPVDSTDPTSTPAPFNQGNGMTLQSSPVVDGKYSFTFTADSPVLEAMAGVEATGRKRRSYHGGIFKVIVRGWDVNSQTPLERSSDDREIALSVKDLKQFVKQETVAQEVAIDLSTTLGSQKKVAGVKADPDYTDDGSFVQSLTTLFFDGLHSINLSSIFSNLIKDEEVNDLTFSDISSKTGDFSAPAISQTKAAAVNAPKALNDLIENYKINERFAEDLQTEFNYIDSMIALAGAAGLEISTKNDPESLAQAQAYVTVAQSLDMLNGQSTLEMSDEQIAARLAQIETQTADLSSKTPAVAKSCSIVTTLLALANSAYSLQQAKRGVDIASFVNSETISADQGSSLQASVTYSYSYPHPPVYNWMACCIIQNGYSQCSDY